MIKARGKDIMIGRSTAKYMPSQNFCQCAKKSLITYPDTDKKSDNGTTNMGWCILFFSGSMICL
ncbi:hypothetical protein M667_06905 [Cellulophaga baltica NN016038]|nr:hypothetical protein M667_06905 [Cellulophaga baltica NN016038]